MTVTTAELVGTGQPGTIYLLHFDRPFRHARHYLGWARRLEDRLAVHGKAHGSALMRAVADAGIGWQLARTWPGDRHRERQLKAQGSRGRLCPICRATETGQSHLFDPTAGGQPMTTTMTATTGGGVLRDQWGRYLIPDPGTGEQRAWTRVTTVARTLADRTVLEAWERRNIVLGIGARQDLYAQAASCTLADTRTLNEIVAQAKGAAAAAAGANTGSALHRFTERLDAGELLEVPEPWDRDVAAYQTTMAAHGIGVCPGWLERVLLIPDAGAAGTCDRLLSAAGWVRPRIGDLKTGQDLRYAMCEIALQLALYAHATHWYDPTTGELHPIDIDIDRSRALVMHLPAGQGTCDLYDIDIAAGWDAVTLALAVRQWRNRKDLAHPLDDPGPAT